MGGPGPGPGGGMHGGNGRPRGRNGGQRRFKDPNDRGPYPDNEPLADNGEPGVVEPGIGVLELHPNGYGFYETPRPTISASAAIPSCPAR